VAALKDSVLVVLVLRDASLRDVPARTSLEAAPRGIAVRLYDNGGGRIPGFLPPSWCLVRDHRNPGVAPRYLDAAAAALSEGRDFLLLLDQDFCAEKGWWECYEAAVSSFPEAQAWGPQLRCAGRKLSPMRLRRGLPRFPAEGVVPAANHLLLNSGLLVRAAAVQRAADALALCPLDFSDYALCWSMGRAGGYMAPVPLELEHSLSTFAAAAWEARLARYRWFAYGARGWGRLNPRGRLRIGRWALGRAVKLAFACRTLRFLKAFWDHYVLGRPPERWA
jgi:hypothetical protein